VITKPGTLIRQSGVDHTWVCEIADDDERDQAERRGGERRRTPREPRRRAGVCGLEVRGLVEGTVGHDATIAWCYPRDSPSCERRLTWAALNAKSWRSRSRSRSPTSAAP